MNLDWRNYRLRSGIASLATYNGVSDRLSKRDGGRKSDSAKDGYIEDSLEFDFVKINSYTNVCLKFLCDAKLITPLLIF